MNLEEAIKSTFLSRIYYQENMAGLPYFLPLDSNINNTSPELIIKYQANLEEGISSIFLIAIYYQKNLAGLSYFLLLATNIKNRRHMERTRS